jgi:MarR family transcriptional regulator, organic hydroperoxide resistance regulator
MAKRGLQKEIGQKRPFRSPKVEAAIAIMRTADVLRTYFERMFIEHELTGQQYNVLRILRGAHPEKLPTMTIAERMIEKSPGITGLLDRLESKSLVSRERGTEDRRCFYCGITPEGLELLGVLDGPVDAADEEVMANLTLKEAQTLIQLLERVRDKAT